MISEDSDDALERIRSKLGIKSYFVPPQATRDKFLKTTNVPVENIASHVRLRVSHVSFPDWGLASGSGGKEGGTESESKEGEGANETDDSDSNSHIPSSLTCMFLRGSSADESLLFDGVEEIMGNPNSNNANGLSNHTKHPTPRLRLLHPAATNQHSLPYVAPTIGDGLTVKLTDEDGNEPANANKSLQVTTSLEFSWPFESAVEISRKSAETARILIVDSDNNVYARTEPLALSNPR